MAEIKLKPCPFCGKHPIFKHKSNVCAGSINAAEFVIYCSNCGYEYGKLHRFEIKFDLTLESGIVLVNDGRIEAAEAWNKRSEPPEEVPSHVD